VGLADLQSKILQFDLGMLKFIVYARKEGTFPKKKQKKHSICEQGMTGDRCIHVSFFFLRNCKEGNHVEAFRFYNSIHQKSQRKFNNRASS
jgi:hypothetical protein